MSYIVTLRDGTTHKLDDEDGKSLQEAWETAKRPFPAHLGNASILSSQFVSISKEQLTEADWIPDIIEAEKRIEAKDRCRGQYSIQCEINNIAKSVSLMRCDHNPDGLKWNKLIVDKAWRERIRQELRSTGQSWCDYKVGECACEAEYLSNRPRHGSWE